MLARIKPEHAYRAPLTAGGGQTFTAEWSIVRAGTEEEIQRNEFLETKDSAAATSADIPAPAMTAKPAPATASTVAPPERKPQEFVTDQPPLEAPADEPKTTRKSAKSKGDGEPTV